MKKRSFFHQVGLFVHPFLHKAVGTVVAVLLPSMALAGAGTSSENRILPFYDAHSPNTFALDVQGAIVNGSIQVRENYLEGTYLSLDDAGIGYAAAVTLEYIRQFSAVSSIRIPVRFFIERGQHRLSEEVYFNGVRYGTGRPLKSAVHIADINFRWERRLIQTSIGADLQFLLGLNLTILSFATDGEVLQAGDMTERFYQQVMPLPLLGLNSRFPLNSTAMLCAEIFGFTVNNLNSLRSEGGKVRISQDNLQTSLALKLLLKPGWYMRSGIRYDYLMINEQSHEDGNVFHQSSFGLFARFEWCP